MDYPNSANRTYGEISWRMIPQDPFDLHKGFKVAIQSPLGISYMDHAQVILATRSPSPTYGYPMPNFAEWSESNRPISPNGPTPNPPPGSRQSFSALHDIHDLLLKLANFMAFHESKSSAGSFFANFGDGGGSKHEDDDLASETAQRRGDEINILLEVMGELRKRTKDLDQNLQDNFWNLQKAQIKTLEELYKFTTALINELEFRNQLQPPKNPPNNPPIYPDGEESIPEPVPQIPFHQVEPNTPGEGLAPDSEIPWLGATVEPKGPRGDVSNLVSTLPGKTYSNTDTEGPQRPPLSDLGAKGPKGPRPGQPTFPHPEPKPDRTPPSKPEPKPQQ